MTIPPDAEAFIREIPGRSAFAARVVRQQAPSSRSMNSRLARTSALTPNAAISASR